MSERNKSEGPVSLPTALGWFLFVSEFSSYYTWIDI